MARPHVKRSNQRDEFFIWTRNRTVEDMNSKKSNTFARDSLESIVKRAMKNLESSNMSSRRWFNQMSQWIVAENHVASVRMKSEILLLGIGIRLDRFVVMNLLALIGQRTSTMNDDAHSATSQRQSYLSLFVK